MKRYSPDQIPNLCVTDPDDPLIRYALGRTYDDGQPLVVIGKNPSHAREDLSDETIQRLIEISQDPTKAHGPHRGWIMLNLWPVQGNPGSLLYDENISKRNREIILRIFAERRLNTALAAWGSLAGYPALRQAKEDMRETLRLADASAYTLDPLTRDGEPRHLRALVGPPLTLDEDPIFIMDEDRY